MTKMLSSENAAILARIKKLEDAGRAMVDLSEKLYLQLEENLLKENGIVAGETVVTNRFGEFLVVGVDNLTLDQPFSREQPALSGLLNNKGNPKIVLTPWKVKK